MARLVSVAVPVPFLPPLTYRVPDGVADPPVGGRVRVPIGRRVVTGCVVPPAAAAGGDRSGPAPPAASPAAGAPRLAAPPTPASAPSRVGPAPPAGAPPLAPGQLRDLIESLDHEAYLPADVLDLALWVADYYVCGAGEALAAAMPPLAFPGRGAGRAAAGFKTVRVVRLTPAGAAATASAAPPAARLGPRQRAVLRRLGETPLGLESAQLAREGLGASSVAGLRRRGLVRVESRRVERDPFASGSGGVTGRVAGEGDPGRTLTAEQRAALDELAALAALRAFRVALLHGVTGSGKTEVYLRLARDAVSAGRRALVLVPEIALTPAVASTFRAAFGDRVAIQHSGLSPGERHDQWHRIRRAEVDVVVGTRSAVFAPLADLGLVVVDEEHDASYKQDENPRYHARSVAIVRARGAGALVVLGSATPSLETCHHARRGRYRRVVMTGRIHRRPLPAVRIVDMRAEAAAEGADVVLSRSLAEALEVTLGRGEQALVLLNRRGFATAILCRQCGRTFECPNCSVSLTLHRGAGRARCHYCNYSVARPSTCAHCAGPYLDSVGFGTERIEAEIATRFPEAAVARLDRDAVRRRGAGPALLARFREGGVQVLVGTQMIAKGHDFPNVTLVGVISADVGLGLADFRAAERTFQLLTQVAGRAGRGERPGQAIIQSFHPEHYSITYACRQAYEPFFEEELRYRVGLRYPPVVSMVNAVVQGRSIAAAMRDAADLAALIRADASGFTVLGPAVAPLSRLRGRHRAQFFLKGVRRAAMRRAVRTALEARPSLRRRVTIDVDPLNLL